MNVNGTIEDKVVSTDELPYFSETYAGKLCCLCNLGERSSLGQGDLIRLVVQEACDRSGIPGIPPAEDEKYTTSDLSKRIESIDNNTVRKMKVGISKKGGDSIYELDKVGHIESLNVSMVLDSSFLYVHRMCAMWSTKGKSIENMDMTKILSIFTECLDQKCTFCGLYGASVNCKMNCSQVHHWPCAAASGCFLILETFTAFCSAHLSQVPLLCNENNIECQSCSTLGDISRLVMCCTCGYHFHSTCIGLANFPDTKAGWNCSRCSICQICRQQETNDARYVKCEQCQKIYHANCLRPVISSIPKYGWKCNRCRVCSDCGSRTPGAGTSSRWHCHYTICDSCYQQRNKGFSCPICQKAYRAAAYKEMVKCSVCLKFVHSSCDEEADLTTYHKKKECNPDYDYVCPQCKSGSLRDLQSIDESSLTQFNDGLCKDTEIDSLEKHYFDNISVDEPTKLSTNNNTKKRVCVNSRGKCGKFVLQKPGPLSQISKKRGARGKGRQLILHSNFNAGERYICRNMDSEVTSEKRMLLFSVRDKFVLTQDICVMCASLGIGSDAALITCAQCGQCYHTYCVNVKPSKIMMQRGWRCLDCTICEGCGKKNDEARLLLCDECDISYHIYCVNPPLETVPHGNWKCNSCAMCQKCGRNISEKNSTENSLFECEPCRSQSKCPSCTRTYKEGEAIIQCVHCDQWYHFACDSINKMRKVEYYDSNEYYCTQCRTVYKLPSNSVVENTTVKKEIATSQIANLSCSENKLDTEKQERNLIVTDLVENSEITHWVDGVCVSDYGLNMIKSLTTEIKRKRKLRQTAGLLNKESGESAGLEETINEKQLVENFKDGMLWEGPDTTPPEGFAIVTNEEGLNILRKKRQRNLQKLGIGGFSVRNRAVRKDNEDATSMDQINSGTSNIEKKKKIVKKKLKNKLMESYPLYLQEAFFGKTLLESNVVQTYDSESSDGLESITILTHFNTDENDRSLNRDKCKVTLAYDTNATGRKKCKKENLSDFTERLMESGTQKTIRSMLSVPNDISGNDIVSNVETGNTMCVQQTESVMDHFSGLCPPNSMPTIMSNRNETEENILSSPVSNPIPKYNVPVVSEIKLEEGQLNRHFVANNIVEHETLKSQNAKQQSMIIPNVSNQNDRTAASYAHETTPESAMGGTQKTAEKMRRDEDLGLMATISAVLYANTKHPDLKDMYPNWNERCKQILKRWRSLSTDKKAPFLQHAKDNRSALRMHRAQQEQQKINLQQKAQREEELERAWKQRQSKVKESQTNVFVNFSGIQYEIGVEGNIKDHTNNTLIEKYPADNFCSPKSSLAAQRPLVRTMSALPSVKTAETESSAYIEPSSYGALENNKKLRNLLQKQHSAPIIGENEDSVINEIGSCKLNLLSNSGLRLNNPMLGSTDKIETSEFTQNIQDFVCDIRTELSDATAELESDENVGLGDILSGLGDGDDDDLLKSLTSEIGDDFNILEYADPDLDVIPNSQSVLNSLDFEESEKST